MVEGDVLGRQGVLVDIHQDFPGLDGKDLGRGDAVDPLQPGRHFVLDELLELEGRLSAVMPQKMTGNWAMLNLTTSGSLASGGRKFL